LKRRSGHSQHQYDFEQLKVFKRTEAQLRQQVEDAIRTANGVEAKASTAFFITGLLMLAEIQPVDHQ
jgi:hypothetical protein